MTMRQVMKEVGHTRFALTRRIEELFPGTVERRRVGKKTVEASGYVTICLAKDDPMVVMSQRKDSPRALEHRLVVARYIGRPLTAKEIVHHKNGNRSDNRIENLQLCNVTKHPKGQSWCCADCGSHNIVATEIHES